MSFVHDPPRATARRKSLSLRLPSRTPAPLPVVSQAT